MNRKFNPADIDAPLGKYSHGVEVPPNARWLYASGQVGIAPDGKLQDGFEAQCATAYANLTAILKDAGMDWNDVVKVTSFITDLANVPALRRVRDAEVGGAQPASTLLVIAGLANPDLLVEIELVAAKA